MRKIIAILAVLSAGSVQAEPGGADKLAATATMQSFEVTFAGEGTNRVVVECDRGVTLESKKQWGDKPVAKVVFTCIDQAIFGEAYVNPQTIQHFTGPGVDVQLPSGYDVLRFKREVLKGDTLVLGPTADQPVVTIQRAAAGN